LTQADQVRNLAALSALWGLMFFSVLTLFPDAIRAYLDDSILGKAQAAGHIRFQLVDFRQFTGDRHLKVDDRPFGGGPGMVLKPEPIFDAIEEVEGRFGPHHRILLSPRGRTFDQEKAAELAGKRRILLLCGRYEGFDERVRQGLEWDEISLGDFVLSGGELPALTIIEAVSRLIPGVLGSEESAIQDSFQGEGLVDHPHYTRPLEFRGLRVPEVLRSGNHKEIDHWRLLQRKRLTVEKESREKKKR
jgi:tRNA (guanine37-N1)-methyltransferase